MKRQCSLQRLKIKKTIMVYWFDEIEISKCFVSQNRIPFEYKMTCFVSTT
jgi:hypothetical protein